MTYVENIFVFHVNENLKEGEIKNNNYEHPLSFSSILWRKCVVDSETIKYTYEIENKSNDILQKKEQEQGEKQEEQEKEIIVDIFEYRFGYAIQLTIKLEKEIGGFADKFDFEDEYKNILFKVKKKISDSNKNGNEKNNKTCKNAMKKKEKLEKIKKLNTLLEKDDYLFHQHIIKDNSENEDGKTGYVENSEDNQTGNCVISVFLPICILNVFNNPSGGTTKQYKNRTDNAFSVIFSVDSIKWSYYEYKYKPDDKTKLPSILDIDTYILERHVLFNTFSKEYLQLLGNEKKLKDVRKKLNEHRRIIAEHELMIQEFKSKVIEFIEAPLDDDERSLFEIHRVDKTKEIYQKLEKDLEHYAEELESERQFKTSRKVEYFVFALGLLGIVSIFASILSMITTKPFYSETNASVPAADSLLDAVAHQYSLFENAFTHFQLNYLLFASTILLIFVLVVLIYFSHFFVVGARHLYKKCQSGFEKIKEQWKQNAKKE